MLQHAVEMAAPWKDVYDNSTALATAIIALHLTSLLVGGGLAIAADRATLRVSAGLGDNFDARRRQVAELATVHRPILAALTILFVTGIALTAADLETYVQSPIYWIKFGFIVLLLANGLVMTRTEQTLGANADLAPEKSSSLWRRLRWSAWTSIALWITTLVLGTALVNLA